MKPAIFWLAGIPSGSVIVMCSAIEILSARKCVRRGNCDPAEPLNQGKVQRKALRKKWQRGQPIFESLPEVAPSIEFKSVQF
jgi:hypothetical protein